MTKRNRKIALLIHSLSPGGMERVMTELANYFSKIDNTEVHLVLFGRLPIVFYNLDKNVNLHKPLSRFNDRYRNIESVKRSLFIRRKVRQINPDTVLSFGIHWNNFVLLSLLFTRYPVFVSDRGSPVRKYSKFHRLSRNILYRTSAGIIAQTEVAKEITKEILPKANIVVIGNPIRAINDHSKLLKKENIILTVGRLITSKHHDRMIRIFSKLNAPDWKLIIVGGNALKQNNFKHLKSLIEKLNMQDRIILAGEQKNVEDYYLKSKVFVFTSTIEGFPNVIGEALSAGLPVISYDCISGPSEMITDEINGYLVPNFEDDLFRNKLQYLIDHEKILKQMAIEAKNSVKRFEIESIGQQFYSFITS